MNSEDTGSKAIEWVALSLMYQRVKEGSFGLLGRDGEQKKKEKLPAGSARARFEVKWQGGREEVLYGTTELCKLHLGFIENLFGKKIEGAKWKEATPEYYRSKPKAWREGKYMVREDGVVAFVRRES